MAAPCFESQTKNKLKIEPAVAKAFMQEILDHMSPRFAKEGTVSQEFNMSYPDALQAVSEKSGLQPETINQILKRDPQVMSRTKQAIARSGEIRQIRNAADAFAGELKSNAAMLQEPGNLAKAWDLQRRIALGGHSVVFPWSHMRNWAVQIPTEAGKARMSAFWQAATDVYKYAGTKGKALYEMDMALMEKGDRYDFWKQEGADIVPGRRTPGDILLATKKPKWAGRNFDALKPARYSALEDIWSRADPALREGDTGKAYGAVLARDLNYATGSVMFPVGEAAGTTAKSVAQLSALAGKSNLLLSSKLFFAKHMDAWMSPLRYLLKGGKMSVAENAAKNVALGRWANTVATHLSILGINYAFNKLMGWETPNLTDPSKSDFWRLKVGGIVIPFSPMLEAIRLPIVVTAAFATKGSDEAGTKVWRAAWNAAHPALHTLYEQVSGKDYLGRPVPSVRGLIGKEFPSTAPRFSTEKAQEQIGGVEYALTRATPIAPSGAISEFYQALRHQGINHNMAMALIKSAGVGLSSAFLGQHMYEPEPQKPQRASQPPRPLPSRPSNTPWWKY